MRAFVTLETDRGRCHVNLRALLFMVPRGDGGLDLVFTGNTRLSTTPEWGRVLLDYIRVHDPLAETLEFEFPRVPDEDLEAASRLLALETERN